LRVNILSSSSPQKPWLSSTSGEIGAKQQQNLSVLLANNGMSAFLLGLILAPAMAAMNDLASALRGEVFDYLPCNARAHSQHH